MMNNLELLVGKSLMDFRQIAAQSNVNVPEPEQIGDESYIELPDEGISCVLPDGAKIAAVHLHAEGRDGYSQYKAPIYGGVNFEMSRSIVRGLLGAPHRFSDGANVPFLGKKAAWDMFLRENFSINIEYVEEGCSVSMVTFS